MSTAENPNLTDLIPPEQPPEIAKTLDALPGLIGALDQALIDAAGKRMPFVLVVFGGNGAMHATNIVPAGDAVRAVKDLARSWDEADPIPAGSSGDAAPAA